MMTEQEKISFLEEQVKKARDLKERIRLCAILARSNGHSIKTIASILRISKSTVYEYLTDFDKEKKLKSKQYPGRSCKLSKSQEAILEEHIAHHSYSSLQQLCAYIEENYHVTYTLSGLRDWLKRKNLQKTSRKKQFFKKKNEKHSITYEEPKKLQKL